MKNKMIRFGMITLIAIFVLISMTACNAATEVEAAVQTPAPAMADTDAVDQTNPAAAPQSEAQAQEALPGEAAYVVEEVSMYTSVNGLTEAEVAGLIFMREEEKLAHDVYLALFELWAQPVFQNVANSEATHTTAVEHLLDQFQIPDPAADTAPGEFTDPTLQQLYADLIAQGETSLENALRVGAAIEEIDILDLEEELQHATHPEIRTVYENLLSGSENHLRAFVNSLSRTASVTYQPQYLDTALYDAILSEGSSNGNPGRGAGNQGNGKGQ